MLRSKMFELAMNGDSKMCIWLSKQYLGHRESVHVNIDADLRRLEKLSTDELVLELDELSTELKKLPEAG